MADSEETPPPKARKRTVFASESERKRGTRDRKRAFDKTRVNVGSHWEDWEQQRAVEGYKTQTDWIAHLLATHRSRCLLYHQVHEATPDQQDDENKSEGDSDHCMFREPSSKSKEAPFMSSSLPGVYPGDEVIAETPSSKSLQKMSNYLDSTCDVNVEPSDQDDYTLAGIRVELTDEGLVNMDLYGSHGPDFQQGDHMKTELPSETGQYEFIKTEYIHMENSKLSDDSGQQVLNRIKTEPGLEQNLCSNDPIDYGSSSQIENQIKNVPKEQLTPVSNESYQMEYTTETHHPVTPDRDTMFKLESDYHDSCGTGEIIIKTELALKTRPDTGLYQDAPSGATFIVTPDHSHVPLSDMRTINMSQVGNALIQQEPEEESNLGSDMSDRKVGLLKIEVDDPLHPVPRAGRYTEHEDMQEDTYNYDMIKDEESLHVSFPELLVPASTEETAEYKMPPPPMMRIRLRCSKRTDLQPVPVAVDPPDITLTPRTTKWRHKMKRKNPEQYRLLQAVDALRAKKHRMTMSDEGRKRSNEQAAARMRKRRARLKLEAAQQRVTKSGKPKIETRKPAERKQIQRQKWAEQKRNQRSNMTGQMRYHINKRKREKYAEKKKRGQWRNCQLTP